MKCPPLTLASILAVFALLMQLFSCKKDEVTVSNPPEEFVVRIDSLAIQKPALSSDTLRGQLWGTLGPTTCYSFSRFQRVSGDSFSVRIKVFGLYTKASTCGQAVQRLNRAVYRVYPVYRGIFQFEVEQPDGSTLRDTISVL
jgi:hypothetical protein